MNPTLSPVELALLVDRVSRLLVTCEGLAESIRGIHSKLDAIPLIERDVEILQEQAGRLFQAQSSIKNAMNKQNNVVSSHSLIWKICSTVAGLSAAGIIGFGYNTLQSIHGQEAILDRRMSIIEFQLKGINYAAKIKD